MTPAQPHRVKVMTVGDLLVESVPDDKARAGHRYEVTPDGTTVQQFATMAQLADHLWPPRAGALGEQNRDTHAVRR